MSCLYVLLICLPYMSALYVGLDSTNVRIRRAGVYAVAEALMVLEALILQTRQAWWNAGS